MAKGFVLYGFFLWLILGLCDYAGGGVVGSCELSVVSYEHSSITSLRPKWRSLYATIGGTPTYMRTDFSTPLRYGRNDDDGDKRAELQQIFRKEIGVREATGKNDGLRVEQYLESTGLGKSYAWCASYVSFVFSEAGYHEPRTAWSPALFQKSRVIWERGKSLKPNTCSRRRCRPLFR